MTKAHTHTHTHTHEANSSRPWNSRRMSANPTPHFSPLFWLMKWLKKKLLLITANYLSLKVLSYILPQWVFIQCLGHLLYSQHQDEKEEFSCLCLCRLQLFLSDLHSFFSFLLTVPWFAFESESENHSVLFNSATPCTIHGILQARILEWVAFPSLGHLPNPGIEPRSPALQVNS